MVNSLGDGAFAEIQNGLELFEYYGAMNYLSDREQDGGIFNGIDALEKAIKDIDIKKLLTDLGPDGKTDLHLLPDISRLVLAMEQAQTAATRLADPDQDIPQKYYGQYYYKLREDGQWTRNEDTPQAFKAHERVNEFWMPVLWDIFNLEQNPQNEPQALNTLQSLSNHFLTPPSGEDTGEDKSAVEEKTTLVEQQPSKFFKKIKDWLRYPLGLLPEPEPEPESESEPESDYSKFLKQFETAQESLGEFGPLFNQFKDVYGKSLYKKCRYRYSQYVAGQPLGPDNTEFQDKTREQKITFVLRGIAEIIRSDLLKRYSPKDGQTIPSELEETLKNLCLKKYAKDFEAIKHHIHEGCSQVSGLLLEKLNHIGDEISSTLQSKRSELESLGQEELLKTLQAVTDNVLAIQGDSSPGSSERKLLTILQLRDSLGQITDLRGTLATLRQSEGR
jgi:hypothetical protein